MACPLYTPYWRPMGVSDDRYKDIAVASRAMARAPRRISDALIDIAESEELEGRIERAIAVYEYVAATMRPMKTEKRRGV
jgi:hypothetical protein